MNTVITLCSATAHARWLTCFHSLTRTNTFTSFCCLFAREIHFWFSLRLRLRLLLFFPFSSSFCLTLIKLDHKRWSLLLNTVLNSSSSSISKCPLLFSLASFLRLYLARINLLVAVVVCSLDGQIQKRCNTSNNNNNRCIKRTCSQWNGTMLV